ncbi:MAG: GWxTD domain-containing protein [Candidatus Acidiferrales bacterium]
MGWPVKAFPQVFLTAFLVCSVPSLANAARHAGNQDQNQKQKSKTNKQSERELYKELSPQYKRWLDEDVIYIITPEERRAFLHLQTNEEREQFIEAFWQRRNPDPDSPENTYKEEYYRRIAYANEHFASGIPGWKTDRGKIYIMWGKPDEIDSHPTGGTWDRPMDQGGGETTTYPYEDWRYRYLPGMGENVELEFVDPTGTGEYHLTMDPSEKDALLHVPGAGLTMAESMGLASKSQRFSNTDGTNMAEGEFGGMPLNNSDEEFNRLEQYANIMRPPPVKFKDLEAVVTSHMVRDQLKFDYHYDFLRITSDTVLVPITVQIPVKQLTFQQKDGVDSASMNLFARITSMTGRVVQTFEDSLRADYAADQLQHAISTSRIYQKAVPLAPGLYELDIVIKDVNSGNVGVVNTRLPVPRYQDDTLSASSLILADDIQPVSMRDIGVGQFVLGDVKVQPQLDHTFTPNQSMGIFLQVYNLKVNGKTNRANTSVELRVVKDKATTPALKFDLPSSQLPEHGEELTLEKKMTLGSLAPGKYKLEIAVTDNLAKQTITPTANFTIRPLPATSTQGR